MANESNKNLILMQMEACEREIRDCRMFNDIILEKIIYNSERQKRNVKDSCDKIFANPNLNLEKGKKFSQQISSQLKDCKNISDLSSYDVMNELQEKYKKNGIKIDNSVYLRISEVASRIGENTKAYLQ